ncbi:MAG: hypothetical protein ACRDH2_01080 [Anaerolineales bacterium]
MTDKRSSVVPPACPFCASTETELFALFSQFLLASQYYCRHCRTVFDVVRWEETDLSAGPDLNADTHSSVSQTES